MKLQPSCAQVLLTWSFPPGVLTPCAHPKVTMDSLSDSTSLQELQATFKIKYFVS